MQAKVGMDGKSKSETNLSEVTQLTYLPSPVHTSTKDNSSIVPLPHEQESIY